MELPNGQLRLLSSCPPAAAAGNVASDDDSYPDAAVRVTIQEWYALPSDLAIVLDVDRVRPYLSREYRDVFEIYARGYPLKEVARYWRNVTPTTRSRRARVSDRLGCEVVNRLIRQIQRYLRLYDVPSAPECLHPVTAS